MKRTKTMEELINQRIKFLEEGPALFNKEEILQDLRQQRAIILIKKHSLADKITLYEIVSRLKCIENNMQTLIKGDIHWTGTHFTGKGGQERTKQFNELQLEFIRLQEKRDLISSYSEMKELTKDEIKDKIKRLEQEMKMIVRPTHQELTWINDLGDMRRFSENTLNFAELHHETIKLQECQGVEEIPSKAMRKQIIDKFTSDLQRRRSELTTAIATHNQSFIEMYSEPQYPNWLEVIQRTRLEHNAIFRCEHSTTTCDCIFDDCSYTLSIRAQKLKADDRLIILTPIASFEKIVLIHASIKSRFGLF